MKVLKTIVATAVIVFALTTVAMAGVQHFTKQGSQTTDAQAQETQPTYTVTLTATQLAQLMHGGQAAATGGVHHARHTTQHPKATRHDATRHHATRHHASDTTHDYSSASGGTHHSEPAHHTYSSGSSGNCDSGESHHSNGGHDGESAVTDQAARSVQGPDTACRPLPQGERLNPGGMRVALSSELLS